MRDYRPRQWILSCPVPGAAEGAFGPARRSPGTNTTGGRAWLGSLEPGSACAGPGARGEGPPRARAARTSRAAGLRPSKSGRAEVYGRVRSVQGGFCLADLHDGGPRHRSRLSRRSRRRASGSGSPPAGRPTPAADGFRPGAADSSKRQPAERGAGRQRAPRRAGTGRDLQRAGGPTRGLAAACELVEKVRPGGDSPPTVTTGPCGGRPRFHPRCPTGAAGRHAERRHRLRPSFRSRGPGPPGKALAGALGDQVALDLGEHPAATDRAARVR